MFIMQPTSHETHGTASLLRTGQDDACICLECAFSLLSSSDLLGAKKLATLDQLLLITEQSFVFSLDACNIAPWLASQWLELLISTASHDDRDLIAASLRWGRALLSTGHEALCGEIVTQLAIHLAKEERDGGEDKSVAPHLMDLLREALEGCCGAAAQRAALAAWVHAPTLWPWLVARLGSQEQVKEEEELIASLASLVQTVLMQMASVSSHDIAASSLGSHAVVAALLSAAAATDRARSSRLRLSLLSLIQTALTHALPPTLLAQELTHHVPPATLLRLCMHLTPFLLTCAVAADRSMRLAAMSSLLALLHLHIPRITSYIASQRGLEYAIENLRTRLHRYASLPRGGNEGDEEASLSAPLHMLLLLTPSRREGGGGDLSFLLETLIRALTHAAQQQDSHVALDVLRLIDRSMPMNDDIGGGGTAAASPLPAHLLLSLLQALVALFPSFPPPPSPHSPLIELAPSRALLLRVSLDLVTLLLPSLLASLMHSARASLAPSSRLPIPPPLLDASKQVVSFFERAVQSLTTFGLGSLLHDRHAARVLHLVSRYVCLLDSFSIPPRRALELDANKSGGGGTHAAMDPSARLLLTQAPWLATHDIISEWMLQFILPCLSRHPLLWIEANENERRDVEQEQGGGGGEDGLHLAIPPRSHPRVVWIETLSLITSLLQVPLPSDSFLQPLMNQYHLIPFCFDLLERLWLGYENDWLHIKEEGMRGEDDERHASSSLSQARRVLWRTILSLTMHHTTLRLNVDNVVDAAACECISLDRLVPATALFARQGRDDPCSSSSSSSSLKTQLAILLLTSLSLAQQPCPPHIRIPPPPSFEAACSSRDDFLSRHISAWRETLPFLSSAAATLWTVPLQSFLSCLLSLPPSMPLEPSFLYRLVEAMQKLSIDQAALILFHPQANEKVETHAALPLISLLRLVALTTLSSHDASDQDVLLALEPWIQLTIQSWRFVSTREGASPSTLDLLSKLLTSSEQHFDDSMRTLYAWIDETLEQVMSESLVASFFLPHPEGTEVDVEVEAREEACVSLFSQLASTRPLAATRLLFLAPSLPPLLDRVLLRAAAARLRNVPRETLPALSILASIASTYQDVVREEEERRMHVGEDKEGDEEGRMVKAAREAAPEWMSKSASWIKSARQFLLSASVALRYHQVKTGGRNEADNEGEGERMPPPPPSVAPHDAIEKAVTLLATTSLSLASAASSLAHAAISLLLLDRPPNATTLFRSHLAPLLVSFHARCAPIMPSFPPTVQEAYPLASFASLVWVDVLIMMRYYASIYHHNHSLILPALMRYLLGDREDGNGGGGEASQTVSNENASSMMTALWQLGIDACNREGGGGGGGGYRAQFACRVAGLRLLLLSLTCMHMETGREERGSSLQLPSFPASLPASSLGLMLDSPSLPPMPRLASPPRIPPPTRPTPSWHATIASSSLSCLLILHSFATTTETPPASPPSPPPSSASLSLTATAQLSTALLLRLVSMIDRDISYAICLSSPWCEEIFMDVVRRLLSECARPPLLFERVAPLLTLLTALLPLLPRPRSSIPRASLLPPLDALIDRLLLLPPSNDARLTPLLRSLYSSFLSFRWQRPRLVGHAASSLHEEEDEDESEKEDVSERGSAARRHAVTHALSQFHAPLHHVESTRRNDVLSLLLESGLL